MEKFMSLKVEEFKKAEGFARSPATASIRDLRVEMFRINTFWFNQI